MRFYPGAVRTGLVVVGLVVAAGIAWQIRGAHQRDAFAQERSGDAPLRVRELGTIPAPVKESSGLAVSRAYPGIFWTHNDSGDGPYVYALDSTAALVATVYIMGAEARDWEDMDIGRCPEGSGAEGSCLYLADTGDNEGQRESVTVYVVAEPNPDGSVDLVDAISSVSFSYEGGSFDVEALAVTPDGGLILATKGRAPTMRVFRIEPEGVARAGATGERLVLTSPITLPIEPNFFLGRWLTGASLNEAGEVLALRTYSEVYFYEWPLALEPVEAAPACFLGRLEPIGEAVAFGPDERLFLTSESPGERVGRLLEIECAGVGR